MSKWLKYNCNKEQIVLLPTNHKFIRIDIWYIHCIDHAAIEVYLANLQSTIWVQGVGRIINLVTGKCVKCRKFENNWKFKLWDKYHKNKYNLLPILQHFFLFVWSFSSERYGKT